MPLIPPTRPRPQIDSYAPLSRRVLVYTYAKVFTPNGAETGTYTCTDDYSQMRWYLLPAHDFVQQIRVTVSVSSRVKQEPRKRQNLPDAPPDVIAVWPTMWTGELTCFLPFGTPILLGEGTTDESGEAALFPVTPDSLLRNPIFVLNGRIQMRWAWDRNENTVEAAPLYEGRILRVTPAFTNAGVTFTVELVGEMSDAADLGMGANADGSKMKPISWKEGADPSSVAHALADRYGWGRVVEPSDTMLTKAGCITFNERIDPVAQLHANVAPYASANGRPFIAYMLPGRELHFHSAFFAADPAKLLMRSYIVHAHDRGEVISFDVASDSLSSYLSGAGNAVFYMMDSRTGVPQLRRKTWNGMGEIPPNQRPPAPTNAAYIDYPDAAKKVVKHFTGIEMPPPSADIPPAKFAALLGQRYHATLADARFKGTLQVRGTHRVVPDPSRFIEINYYTMGAGGNAESSYLSGFYRVTSVEHDVGTTWTTTCEVIREGAASGKQQLASPLLNIVTDDGAIDD